MRFGRFQPAARNTALVCAWTFGLLAASAIAAAEWTRKTTTSDWTWFEDYLYAWATYRVACEPERQCQVGVGVFAFGQPRGEKISFTGERDILVVGFGAIHIRPADGKGPVKAAVAPSEHGLLKATWDS